MMKYIGQYLPVEADVELYCVDVGTGDPIVFIPGLTYSSEIFEAQIEHFSKTNRVIALDPRSQGRSSKVLHGNDYATHGQDLAKVLDILGIQQAVLVGWSTGNLTIWSYIEQFGTARVKSAALIDMSPKPISTNEADWVEGSLDELCEVTSRMLNSQQGQRAFFTEYATQTMVQRDLSEEELFSLIDISMHTPFYITHTLFTNAITGDYRKGCQALNDSVPSMIFIAEHWAQTAEPYMQKNYPHIKTHVMGGHLMFWEYPEEFNRQLEQFMNA